MRGALLATISLLAMKVTACHQPVPVVRPTPAIDQQVMAATNFALECMSSAGVDCLADGQAREGWSAQGDLELLTKMPLALLPIRMLDAAADLADSRVAADRVVKEGRRAEMLARDLSCTAISATFIGERFLTRREQLSRRARWLGLANTTATTALTTLLTATVALDRVRLVEVSCDSGKVFALVAPPSERFEADDDPQAGAGGGWEVFAVSDDAARLIDGYRHPPRPFHTLASDAAPDKFVHPWLPITEIEL